MRKLVLGNNVKNSNNGNCIQINDDSIGSMFDFGKKKRKKEMLEESIEIENEENIIDNENEVDVIDSFSINKQNNIKMLQENMLCYISGYVVKKLGNINCYSCAENLLQNNKEYNNNNVLNKNIYRLLDYNNNRGLVGLFISVYKIILETEKQIKLLTNNFSKFLFKNLDLKVITQVKNQLALDTLIFANLNCENTDILEIPHKVAKNKGVEKIRTMTVLYKKVMYANENG